jgi:hypothetical protein
MATTEIVYKNRDNPISVNFYEDNVAMDFTAVTRVVLKLYNSAMTLKLTVDSSTSPAPISWATNVITFSINDESIDYGAYQAEVIVYDSSHPDGQVIAHPQSNDDLLVIKYVEA